MTMSSLLGRMSMWSKRRWAVLGGLLSVGVGAGVWLVLLLVAERGTVGARALAAIFGAVVTSWAVFLSYLQIRQSRHADELRAFVNIRPLTKRLPVDLGGWAANPVLVDQLMRFLCGRRPNQVVECGSGWTTVLTAACLDELGCGAVVALEHEGQFAEKTRELLRSYTDTERATVRLAPLRSQNVTGHKRPWYEPDVVESIEGPIDVLFVDGPPGGLATQIRYPAVPLFYDRLAEDCVVILDDGFRDDEKQIARVWGRQLGVAPVLEPRGGGFWILDRKESGNNTGVESLPGDPHAP